MRYGKKISFICVQNVIAMNQLMQIIAKEFQLEMVKEQRNCEIVSFFYVNAFVWIFYRFQSRGVFYFKMTADMLRLLNRFIN